MDDMVLEQYDKVIEKLKQNTNIRDFTRIHGPD